MVQLTGGCLCGNILIVANGEPLRVGICHCMDCRKHHGALFYAAADYPQARQLANAYGDAAADFIEDYIKRSQPQQARKLADYVVTTLQGLSAGARAGRSRARLLAVAELAGQAFETFLHTPDESKDT